MSSRRKASKRRNPRYVPPIIDVWYRADSQGEHHDESQGGDGGDGGSKALYLNSHEDFCVYGPAEAGTAVAHAGDNVVAWCTKVCTFVVCLDG